MFKFFRVVVFVSDVICDSHIIYGTKKCLLTYFTDLVYAETTFLWRFLGMLDLSMA